MNLKTNYTSPINQTPSKNDSDHRNVNQLIPELSSTKNSRIISDQAEISTVVIRRTTILRIIGRKDNKINKTKSQNYNIINRIQDGHFRGYSRMGGSGQKSCPSLKFVRHILQ